MTQTLVRTGPGALPPLLLACVHPAPAVQAVASAAAHTADWDALVQAAAQAGMAGIVATTIRACGVVAPPPARRALHTAMLQHRTANDVRLSALREVLAALDGQGIPAIVMKGPALVAMLYGDPGLRPMSDLDLLVSRRDLLRARDVVRDLGFTDTSPRADRSVEHAHHLPGLVRHEQGLNVLVELHHNAFNWVTPASFEFEQAVMRAHRTAIGSCSAMVPSREDVLWHLCWSVAELWRPFRLLTVTDIIRLAVASCERLDWRRIGAERPMILGTLAVLDRLVPLPELRRDVPAFGEYVTRYAARRVDFAGWPPEPLRRAGGRRGGALRLVADTLWAPLWWIRLTHGLGLDPPGWRARVAHVAGVTGRIVGRMRRLAAIR